MSFSDKGSQIKVVVTGTGADALTYVLLHESSHVLDGACGIVKGFPNARQRNMDRFERHDS